MTALYGFGFPDVLVRIHFPNAHNQGRPETESLPWFWWLSPPEKPFYFQFIGTQAHGAGWQRTQNFPMIKILPIDTQVLQPTPVLGFDTLEHAVEQGAPDQAFGRFKFTDSFFWRVIGQKKPPFIVNEGKPTGPHMNTIISQAVHRWLSMWNFGANDFNRKAAAPLPSDVDGVAYQFPSTRFALPLPTDPTIEGLLFDAGNFYLGPIPGGFWFEGGKIQIFKQAYAFTLNVGQLDFNKWRMDFYPPRRTGFPGSALAGGFETFDCSGYGATNFPLAGPQIIGQ